jgi:hypothetical protein
MPDLIGHSIDRYHILEQLGEGDVSAPGTGFALIRGHACVG